MSRSARLPTPGDRYSSEIRLNIWNSFCSTSPLVYKLVGLSFGVAGRSVGAQVKPRCALLVVCVWAVLPGSSRADPILVSAGFEPTACCGGAAVYRDQFLGSRFDLAEATLVTAVGGQFTHGNGSIFAAILPLAATTGLPPGSGPAELEAFALWSVLFSPPRLTNLDVLLPLQLVLEPGAYGLIFGSGLFGATGSAAMAVTLSLGATQFRSEQLDLNLWSPSHFFEPGVHITRHLVEGEPLATPVPEPGTLVLLLSGIAVLRAATKR